MTTPRPGPISSGKASNATEQPYYRRVVGIDPDEFPNARDVSARIIPLPLYPKMTDTDVHDVAAAVTKIATAYHR
ncbi:dTDP-4-amino-4,6-dideoxygalactose transaminase [Nocardia sp. GAS34]|uniref:DegT/DnrJ/EryC1/StrS family aminotransferase n=1 Tax=unclassified Nocardia TaxID=2637762 RepID=UPI003D200751